MGRQLDLFEDAHFDGKTYDPQFDKERLTSQIRKVFDLMQDAKWRTLVEIERKIKQPQASISARLRDLRKERFGGHTVNRRTRDERKRGCFEYQLVVKHN